jgi:hypothetical protein
MLSRFLPALPRALLFALSSALSAGQILLKRIIFDE